MNKKRKLTNAIVVLILVLFATSCSDFSEQEASRSIRSSSIITTKEDAQVESDASFSTDSSSISVSESVSENEKDFCVEYSDALLIVDYGKESANVYHAQYAPLADSWGDDWMVYGFVEIQDWCRGCPITIDGGDYYVLDRQTAIMNIKNVHVKSLEDIAEGEEIARRMNLDPSSSILCWSYSINDFPSKEFEALDYFCAPVDLEQIQYTRISAQYIDGIPVYGTTSGYKLYTYEWPGVIKGSRLADTGVKDGYHINPSQTCILDIERAKYSKTETVESDMAIVPPESCLEEIKKALMYDPSAVLQTSVDRSKEELLDIWGKTVEVYCMELSYVALDSNPRLCDENGYNEPEEDRMKHELTLVPVWEVYYIITNPKNETTVADGKVMINAITGQSLYSNQYGPNQNKDLYPELELSV